MVDQTRIVPLPSFRDALQVWALIGCTNFGGPAGQIAMMHRMLVEEQRWLSNERYFHALNYCMLLPGPEAQQLATYVGWLMHGVKGGLAAGLLFILPGTMVMLALSLIYVSFADVALVHDIFFGVKAAVLAIVFEALMRIGKRSLRGTWMIVLAVAGFVALFAFAAPFPLVVLGAALIGFFGARWAPEQFQLSAHHKSGASIDDQYAVDQAIKRGDLQHIDPHSTRLISTIVVWLGLWLVPVAVLIIALGEGHVFSQIALFFSTMAVVTFGGAYAVLAYVAQEAVVSYHWLSPGEMADGLALAETTPGPLILVLQHVGFLAGFRQAGIDPVLGGLIAALITLWVTFVPSFLWIFAGAPYAEQVREQAALSAALAAISAAIVGVIANLSLWLAMHTLFADVARFDWGPIALQLPVWTSIDMRAILLTAFAFIALIRLKLSIPILLLLLALSGVLVRSF